MQMYEEKSIAPGPGIPGQGKVKRQPWTRRTFMLHDKVWSLGAADPIPRGDIVGRGRYRCLDQVLVPKIGKRLLGVTG